MCIRDSLSDLFGGGDNSGAYDDYSNALNGLAAKDQPFVDMGLNNSKWLQQMSHQYYNNPYGMYNNAAAHYYQSPVQQDLLHSVTNQMNANAATTEMLGSSSANNELADKLNQLNTADQNNYINGILGLQNQGMQGAQYLSGLGVQALNNQNSLAQEGALGKLQGSLNSGGGILSNILGAGADAAIIHHFW